MTKVCRETFLENVVTALTEYGYKTVHIDEDVLAIGNPHNNLYGIFTNLYNSTFQCTLKLTVGNKNLFIINRKTFRYEETDEVLSILKAVIDETSNIVKASKMFVYSLPFIGNEDSYITLAKEFSNHFYIDYKRTKHYFGLTYTLAICLNESLDLRVYVESYNSSKLVFSKFLTETNYKEVFEEVDELIAQFKKSCEVSKKLQELQLEG